MQEIQLKINPKYYWYTNMLSIQSQQSTIIAGWDFIRFQGLKMETQNEWHK